MNQILYHAEAICAIPRVAVSWHILRVIYGQEEPVRKALARMGYDAFYPFLLTADTSRRLALLPGYMFAQFDPSDAHQWQDIRYTTGVAYILGGARPMVVAEGVIRRWRDESSDDPMSAFDNAMGMLRIPEGQALRVIRGVLQGYLGTCVWSTDSQVALDLAVKGIFGDQVTLDRKDITVVIGTTEVIARQLRAAIDRREILLRVKIRRAIRSNSGEQRDEKLGCTLREFIQHTETKFYGGMTWMNWDSVWRLDHVRPMVMFSAARASEAYHHTNLQPLLMADAHAKIMRDAAIISQYSERAA